MMDEIKPVAWTARSWLASKSGGHFVQDRRQSFDVPLYDQSAIDAAVAAERERLRDLIADDAWSCTFQTFGQYRTALLKALKDTP